MAHYTFAEEPSTLGVVSDDSGNGHTLSLGLVSGGLGPPKWGDDYGISGGGMMFSADKNNSDYLSSTDVTWTSDMRTVMFWIKGKPGSTAKVPFCISNGFVLGASKSEFAIQVNFDTGVLSSWVTIDGTTTWEAQSDPSVLTADSWMHLSIAHHGDEVSFFVNGLSIGLTFVTSTDKTAWISDILECSNPVDRIIVGGAPRYYQPFITLGFSGQLDELTLWDVALDSASVFDEFSKMGGLSSQSFSSISSV